MAAMIFLKVNSVTGESSDSKHKDWTEVKSFEWGANQPGGVAANGTAGKVSFNDLKITAYMDKATPALMKFCASGNDVGKLELEVCKSTGEKNTFCKITLENKVLVTSAQVVGVDHTDSLERLIMSYGFQAGKVTKSYFEKHGAGPESSMAFNITDNVAA